MPNIEDMIIDKINSVEKHLSARMDDLGKSMNELKAQASDRVDKLESRVSVLERAREHTRGMIGAFKWVPQIATTLLGAGVTILIMSLSGNIH